MFAGVKGFFKSVSAVATDAYFNLVTLLLPGNGTNGAQNNTFLDSGTANSGSGFTITRNGTTTQGTFSPFSQTGWSGNFNTSTTYLTVTDTTNLRFGSGNFTIEAWVYRAASGAVQTIASKGASTPTGWVFQISAADKLVFTDTSTSITGATTLNANTWYYVAVVRAGTGTNQTTLYVNATSDATGTSATNFNQTTNMLIGADRSTTNFANGYISNLRLSNTNRTISSTPTSALTADSNTIFLALNSNWFQYTDSTAAYTAMAPTGTPSVQAFSPFAPTAAYSAATNGGSGYFDGNGDYLSAGSNAAFAFGTGAYTVECWVYPTSTANQSFVGNDTTNGSVFYYETAAGFIIAPRAGSSIVSGGIGKLIANQWNHIVYCRASTSTNQTSIFANGERVANGTDSTNWTVTGPCLIGGLAANIYMVTGYISGTRIVKGTDVYGYSNTSITVPTAPPTSITDTQLLLNFTNAGITDATSKNDLETVGNAQISTTQSKFGGSSMYFDGTGDWLSIPASKYWYIGTGDYTIEAWIYPTAWGDLLSCFKTTSPYDGWNLQLGGGGSSNGVMNMFISNGTTFADYNATTTMSLNTWTHIAVVKSGTTLYQFINGTLDKTTTGILTPADSNNVLLVGVSNLSTRPYTGYIDDLRITKGYARYTASFTAPTAPFPTQ